MQEFDALIAASLIAMTGGMGWGALRLWGSDGLPRRAARVSQ
jgi:hypothetical protein